MIEIHTTNYSSKFFCPICGTETTDAKGSVVECKHLVYLGTDDGAEFSIYDEVEEPEDDDEWIQYDAQLNEFRKELDDEHLCIHVDIPAPSGATYSIIYNLNANIKDTKNQQNKECPLWDVWKSTLAIYGITEENL
jgi:hypothetical protein